MTEQTHIIGLGNPVAGDDAIGLRITEDLQSIYHSRSTIKISGCCQSGLYLLDHFIGFKRIVIIDAIVDQSRPVGEIVPLELPEEQDMPPGVSPHFIGIHSVISLGKKYQLAMPEELLIFGIVIHEDQEIRETLSFDLQKRYKNILDNIIRTVDSLTGVPAECA